MVDPISVVPRKHVKDLMGRLPFLGLGSDGKVRGGARQANVGPVVSSSSALSIHFFYSTPKRAYGGVPFSKRWVRDKRQRTTMGGEIVDENGIGGRQGVALRLPAYHSLDQVQNTGQSLYVSIR